MPGQYVFADSSGAVVIPDGQIDEVLAEARKIEAEDARLPRPDRPRAGPRGRAGRRASRRAEPMSDEVGTTRATVVPAGGALPPMPLEDWEPTKDTIHLWAQVVGKIKLALTPLKNQWWNVPLYLDARGLTTRVLRQGESGFRIDLDLVGHRLELVTDAGGSAGFELVDGLSVAAFYERLMGLLAGGRDRGADPTRALRRPDDHAVSRRHRTRFL